ncbi:MAG: hypothetical protein AAF192_05905 [Pseudomonadota bacterium]
MPRPAIVPALAPALVAALLALSPAAPAAAAPAARSGAFELAQAKPRPTLVRYPSGAYEVRYVDNCVVTYDTSGRRTGSRRCIPAQVKRADRLVQEDAASRGGGGLKYRKLASGAARVTYSDGCIVTYNKTGRRSGSRGCRPKQVRRADKVVQQRF